jgi:hypothetical protein
LKSKTEFKNQTNGKVRVDTYFPIGKLTAKSVNSKVYHKAPHHTTDAGLCPGALRILFYVLAAIITMLKILPFLLLFFAGFFLGCNNTRQESIESQTINSDKGISPDTLNLIYDGPTGFTLEYFSSPLIKSNHISSCEIVDSDSSSKMVTRKITFDRNGNIIKDDNNYFQYWFEGTVRGSYSYFYNSSNNLIKMIGITEENSKDSVMTVNNYNQRGQLYSRDRYEFAKKLKPGADRHLPSPEDFEKYPTWNELETYKFSYSPNTVIIETFYEGKITEKEKYVLQFDSLNRLQTTTKYRDTSFVEATRYIYEPNSIVGNLRRKVNDGTDWTYNSKIIIDSNGNQIEKILLNDDGSEKVKMTTTYNEDGTIGRIKYNNSLQFFKYTFY